METSVDTRKIFWVVGSLSMLSCILFAYLFGLRTGTDTVVYDYQFKLENPEGEHDALQYGVWPEVAQLDFFNTVRESLIAEKTNFLEANLSAMRIVVYEEGRPVLEVPIKSKGKEGSWWETPSGLYRAEGKEETHFSSFGHVYMPWSIPFQGNFFIHGWPYYPDGTPVGEGYSGGCIRLENEYAKEVYEHTKIGMPILVFEEAPQHDFTYTLRSPEISAKSYLVADLENNFVLASRNTDEELQTALLQKVLTAVVSSEYKNIEQKITVPERLKNELPLSRLVVGTAYSLYDLFFPLLIEGSEEAERAIEESFGAEYFQNLVQTKAKAIGMAHTQLYREEKAISKSNTTANDLFLFLKYLYSNRPFILSMSANKVNTQTYGVPLFSTIAPIHPFYDVDSFLGGASDVSELNVVHDEYPNEASVALVFASPENFSSDAKDDLISVFSLPFDGEMRTVGIIVLDSNDVKKDTQNLLSFVESLYQ